MQKNAGTTDLQVAFLSKLIERAPRDLDPEIMKEYVRNPRLLEEALRCLGTPVFEDFKEVKVEYYKSLRLAIEDCGFDEFNDNLKVISRFHVSSADRELTGANSYKMCLLSLAHTGVAFVSLTEVFHRMRERLVRPATLKELLAFCSKFPDKMGEFVLVGLGTTLKSKDSTTAPEIVPILFTQLISGHRWLDLTHKDKGWRAEETMFLGVYDDRK